MVLFITLFDHAVHICFKPNYNLVPYLFSDLHNNLWLVSFESKEWPVHHTKLYILYMSDWSYTSSVRQQVFFPVSWIEFGPWSKGPLLPIYKNVNSYLKPVVHLSSEKDYALNKRFDRKTSNPFIMRLWHICPYKWKNRSKWKNPSMFQWFVINLITERSISVRFILDNGLSHTPIGGLSHSEDISWLFFCCGFGANPFQ